MATIIVCMKECGAERNHYAQGARCGHLEGKGRAGQYVEGEEYLNADVAEAAHRFMYEGKALRAWGMGYLAGYRYAVEGSDLPTTVRKAPLPETKPGYVYPF